jgi:DNA polymerase III epsilon subunit-like protein
MPVLENSICDTPIAVVDVETTGMSPGHDRIVELSVVRLHPGRKPELVFDSLINPSRKMAATEIHGITDADVKSAPSFGDVAGALIDATSGCVVCSYNVYFDIRFLNFEFENCGVVHELPHFCLMYMRPMLGLGERCRLVEACRHHQVEYSLNHVSSADALAASRLLERYLDEMERRRIDTYRKLASLRRYKFCDSFLSDPFSQSSAFGLTSSGKVKSRAGFAPVRDATQEAIYSYWELLKTVLADLVIEDSELMQVELERQRTGISFEHVRALHAKAFASIISQCIDDQFLDDKEARILTKAWHCLHTLGWAPGE